VKSSANTCSALNVVLLLQVVDPLNVSLGKTLEKRANEDYGLSKRYPLELLF